MGDVDKDQLIRDLQERVRELEGKLQTHTDPQKRYYENNREKILAQQRQHKKQVRDRKKQLKIRPIEKFPYYMRQARENDLMATHDTVANGWNTNNVPVFDTEGVKVPDVVCKYCSAKFTKMITLTLHIDMYRCKSCPWRSR